MIICTFVRSFSGCSWFGIGETAEEAYINMLEGREEHEYPVSDCRFYKGEPIKVKVTKVWEIASSEVD